ncbi:HutD family protein [Aliisedimentitalea scapharcae]|uniref:HutD family protein n=1 Tax=Aliisedimentitalea scapharcae TaxID=1524259 RepID=A0ABZ2XUG2_9RHOB
MRFDIAICPPVPWKNGGGMTRMLMSQEGPNGLSWRLSLADIQTDGPFSSFPGLQRILTIVSGDGIDLFNSDHRLLARPYQPVSFSGDLALDSQRVGADTRAFNLMFDADQIRGDVHVLQTGRSDLSGTNVVFVMQGAVRIFGQPDLQDGQGARLEGSTQIQAEPGASGLIVSLESRSV